VTVLEFFEDVGAYLKTRRPGESASLLAAFAPEAIAALCEGTGSHDATGLLRQWLAGADPYLARRCVRALTHVYLGSGQAGLDRLTDYGLDQSPQLRDHLPHLIGACASEEHLPEADAALLQALEHPSPARRRAAMRGAGLAWKGLGDHEFACAVEASVRPGDDFVVRVSALECLAAIHCGIADDDALARMDGLLPPTGWQRALDADHNPALAYALAARGAGVSATVVTRVVEPMLGSCGPSRRKARTRAAGLEAHLALHEGQGLAAGPPVWRALEDPIREVRHRALWGAYRLFVGLRGADGSRELARLGASGGPWLRAAAGLCLGEIGGERALGALSDWKNGTRSLAARCAALAEGRLRAGEGASAGAGTLDLLRPRERPAEHALAAGFLFEGSGDPEVSQLLGAAALRRPWRTAVAALRALGMVHRGVGPGEATETFARFHDAGDARRRAAWAEGLVLGAVGRLAWVDDGGAGALRYGSRRLLERPQSESSGTREILASRP